MILVSVLVWPLVPATQVAIHFDPSGHANGYANRWIVLGAMPFVGLLITAIFTALPHLSHHEGNRVIAGNPAYIAGWIGTLLAIFVAHISIVLFARGIAINVATNITFIVALITVAVGNLLGKLEPNDYAGIRTPWTKASYYSWEKTHRVAGRLMVGSGVIGLAAMVVTTPKSGAHVFFYCLFASLLAAVVLSRYYWQRDPDRTSRE
jgi:uncharacterized membrane protein